jgi:Ca2+/Na+ antiporter
MITLLRTPTLKSFVLIMSVVTVPGGVEVYNLCDFFYFYYYYYYYYLLSRDRPLSKPVNQF